MTSRPRRERYSPVDLSDWRFRRHVEAVHRLGPRVVAELLAELGAERSIQTIIDRKVARYAELSPAALAVTGGNRFPSVPVYLISTATNWE